MRLLLALLGTTVAIGFASPASADPPPPPAGDDAGFLAALHQVGMTYANPDAVIASGKAVCSCLNNGESGLELVHDVKTHNPGMDMEQASNFAMIAAKFYCPHQLSKA
ncbi:hypothetical protein MSAS_06860 [Mycobacterium saskatchewanense]|uniref:Glycine cleavage system P protein n=1 Tax=Mycobacterium saskatchewanense TaxID=220927 RepID=A0AAJ3NNX4_9MYCO|nr:DUF732 domain-containing protein [Mycobacterium saskatchewanense]ORW70036.1 glycine cleavage system P protein [Mycobacterium saskatchewanense]BBX61512.1 hypothetical protein MSAS_06860 [Mycobacterium saskatchewanense]